MAATRPKPAKKLRFASPTETRTSFSLTPDTVAILARLKQALDDRLGRSIGKSAVLRALLRHLGQQKEQELAGVLDSLISKELAAGVQWGKAKQKR
jgi:hypothetical protein